MSGAAPEVCVLVGSPRRSGACAALAQSVTRGVGSAGAQANLVYLADYRIQGCTGCGACERTGTCVLEEWDLPAPASRGFSALYEAVRRAGALALVAPVYFSGPPSQLKAFFDRMQPLWAQRYVLGTRPVLPLDQRKPMDLWVVGSGGDPFGHEALISCARSSLRMANYELHGLHNCVGYSGGEQSYEKKAFDEAAALAALL